MELSVTATGLIIQSKPEPQARISPLDKLEKTQPIEPPHALLAVEHVDLRWGGGGGFKHLPCCFQGQPYPTANFFSEGFYFVSFEGSEVALVSQTPSTGNGE